jgi:hypothetical protein
MPGVFTTLQNSVVAAIRADPWFARITVLSEQIGDIENQIQRSLSKLGICAIVLTPGASVKYADAPGPLLDPLTVAIDIVELVLTNRGNSGSKQPASDVAERIAWLLHHPNDPERSPPMSNRLIVRKISLIPDKQFLVYRVELETTGALAGIIET